MDKLKAFTNVKIIDAVSLETAQKMKNNGFPQPPEGNFTQIWETAKGHIIGFYAIDFEGRIVYSILKSNERPEPLNSVPEMLFTFLPNADDILKELNKDADEWASEGPDNESNYKCFRQRSTEQEFNDKNRHEACAQAWLFVHEKNK